ncbi:protein SPO16 homolog [Pristis pectinata]|uniref:protein SPO16 homolog n=1 Tax=Pristis pectinata TaxID=685728 RepID=UPI00223CB526|nr:protein SPO16 homolog [Pristis pectinata]
MLMLDPARILPNPLQLQLSRHVLVRCCLSRDVAGPGGGAFPESGRGHHEAILSLSSQHQRIRFSDSVVTGSIIFPLSGIAFIIIETQDFCDSSAEVKLMKRIEQFVRIHRNSFLLLVAGLYGQKEWDILFKIQLRFLGSNLKIIPSHNAGDVVRSMLTIAKVTCKPHADSIRDRIAMNRAQIIERSPVWEMLRKRQLNVA